jgi:hypothetical protein
MKKKKTLVSEICSTLSLYGLDTIFMPMVADEKRRFNNLIYYTVLYTTTGVCTQNCWQIHITEYLIFLYL